MPETYGLPEPEPEPIERFTSAVNEVVAGQGVVRRVFLYVAVVALAISPLAPLAVVPLVLLMATDPALA
jgi:hypothetical protein